MKAKGLRALAYIFILIGIIAGVVALVMSGASTEGIMIFGLAVALGVVIAIILFVAANNKEKRERINASMEAVEDASIFDPVEEPVEVEEIVADDIILVEDEEVSEFGDLPEFLPEEDLALEPVEEVVEAPKTKYQILRDYVVEKTPITNEQIDKAEKIGKVAIPVAAVATVVLMAAKLSSYRKNDIRRRTFFDWLN